MQHTAQDTFNALKPVTIEDIKAAIGGDWDAGDIDYESTALVKADGNTAFVTVSSGDVHTLTLIGSGTGALGDDTDIGSRYDLQNYVAALRTAGYTIR